MTLDAYPEDAQYGVGGVSAVVRFADGRWVEYRLPGQPPNDYVGPVTSVGRFEFLANLAARGESRLFRFEGRPIAVGGFTGARGWAFERTSDGPAPTGHVREATAAERGAAGSSGAEPMPRETFAETVCYAPRDDDPGLNSPAKA